MTDDVAPSTDPDAAKLDAAARRRKAAAERRRAERADKPPAAPKAPAPPKAPTPPPADPPKAGRPTKVARQAARYKRGILKIGKHVGKRNAVDGQIIMDGAEDLADALAELTEADGAPAWLAKVVETVTLGGAIGQLALAVGGIALPIAINHGWFGGVEDVAGDLVPPDLAAAFTVAQAAPAPAASYVPEAAQPPAEVSGRQWSVAQPV